LLRGSASKCACSGGHRVRSATTACGSWACDSGADFGSRVIGMARKSKPFSPFASPMREHDRFLEVLGQQASAAYDNLKTGFALLDDAIDGIHGPQWSWGGAPKVGKSCFMIQVATELARRSVPVIYYDFENGRQKIYQRTMARLSRVTIEALRRQSFDEPGKVPGRRRPGGI
jgi:replicative DNA helicase